MNSVLGFLEFNKKMEKNTIKSEFEAGLSRRDFLKGMAGVAVATVLSAIPNIAEAHQGTPEFPVTREGTKAKIRWWTDEHFLADMKGPQGAKVYDRPKAAHLKKKLEKFIMFMEKKHFEPLPQSLTGKLSIDFPMVMRHAEKDLIESVDVWIDKKKYPVQDADGMINTYLKKMIIMFELKDGDIPAALELFLR